MKGNKTTEMVDRMCSRRWKCIEKKQNNMVTQKHSRKQTCGRTQNSMIKYLVYFQLITNIQICGGQYPPKQNCLIILLAAPAATAACQVTLFFFFEFPCLRCCRKSWLATAPSSSEYPKSKKTYQSTDQYPISMCNMTLY